MNHNRRDDVDFALFCVFFFSIGAPYYFVKMWWFGLTERAKDVVTLMMLGLVLAVCSYAVYEVAYCPPSFGGVC